MNDDRPPPIDTERPPDGEDMYEASTKVGEASPEMLALMKSARDGDLKAPSVPRELIAQDEIKTQKTERVTDEVLGQVKARRDERLAKPSAEVETQAVEPPPPALIVAETRRAPIVGFSPYGVVVIVLATACAGWLGYVAWQAWSAPDGAHQSPDSSPHGH